MHCMSITKRKYTKILIVTMSGRIMSDFNFLLYTFSTLDFSIFF